MAYGNKTRKSGSTIIVYNNDVNRAISMLRHISAPLIKEVKEKRYYEKPSVRKRRKQKESLRKSRRRQFREF